MKPIYMDYNATTPVDKRVLEEMLPCFGAKFGNASSVEHSFGWEAQEAVDKARQRVAKLINARHEEIVFTSGATEADNLALKGVVGASRKRLCHVITVATEHSAIMDTASYLKRSGCKVTWLPVDGTGLVNVGDVGKAIERNTVLVSVMAANNEIGVLQPIEEIGKLCRLRGVLFHTDAAQAAGKIPLDVETMCIDLMSISGHKMYGPKGVGALYVRSQPRKVTLAPQMHGGGHERRLRSGTINVPGVVGLGKACELAQAEMTKEAERLTALRQRLYAGIVAALPRVHLNGHPTRRLPGNLNLSFECVEGEAVILSSEGVALSTGSACASASHEPSHVLSALGLPDELRHAAIRFGLGRWSTEQEVDLVVEKIVAAVRRLRALSPLWKESDIA